MGLGVRLPQFKSRLYHSPAYGFTSILGNHTYCNTVHYSGFSPPSLVVLSQFLCMINSVFPTSKHWTLGLIFGSLFYAQSLLS